MNTEAKKECRRCSECKNYSHHWTPDPVPDDIGEYGCKHCEARGDGCELCCGDGEVEGVQCQLCMGEGVVFCGYSEGGWVEAAAVEIVGSWDDIEGEAGQASQMEQDPEAGLFVMRDKVRDIILRCYAERKFDFDSPNPSGR